MRINTSTQWILALLLFFTSNFVTQAQTLDATFSSPIANQCPDNLFTLNATNTTYGNSNYSWLITGPNGYSQNYIASSVAVYLTVSGFYDVQLTVTDGVTTASNTQNSFIQVYNNPIINYSVTPTIGCSPLLVTFDGSCSAGSGTFTPTSFSVNVGDGFTYTTEDISHTYISSGTFTPSVAISNSFGCITTGNLSTLTVNSPPTANAGVDQTICANSSVTLNGSIGGSATSISWSGGSGAFSPNNAILSAIYSPSFSEIANGFVNLILTTNDPAGPCSAVSDTVMILFNSLPTVTAPAYFCEGSSAQLSPSSGGAWTSSNAFIASISGSGIATGTSAGNVIFTFTNNATGCSNNTSTVTINSLPIVSSPSSICVGTTGQLSPATGGTWVSNNSSIATVSGIGLVTGLSPGIVSFIFTNAATGCSTTSSNLTVPIDGPLGTITVNNTNLTGCSCYNASITVTTSGATEAKILYNDGQFVQLTPNTTQTVNYSYCNTGGSTITRTPTLYISNGTCEAFIQSSQTISINPIPNVNPILDQIICQDQVSQTIVFSSSNPGTVYNWTQDSPSIGCAGSGSANLIPSFVAQNTTTAPQIATFTVTPSLNGCLGTAINFTITVKPKPTVTISQLIQDNCHGAATIPVNFTSNIPGTSFTWSNTANISIQIGSTLDNVISSNGDLPSFIGYNPSPSLITQTALYNVIPTVNGCDGDIGEFTITVNPTSTVDPIPDQIFCAGDSTTPITFSGSNPNSTYSWFHNNEAIGLSASNGTGSIPAFLAQNTSSFPLISFFTVTPSLNGCLGTAINFTITVNPIPTIFASPDQTVCHYDITIPVNFSGAINNTVYNWTLDNTSIGIVSSGIGNIPAFQAQNPSSSSQIANFIVTPFLDGCTGISDTFLITVNPLPLINAGNDTILCAGQSYTPIANGTATNYYWVNYTNGVSFVPPSTIMLTLNGDLNGCIASDNVLLTVVSNPIASISTFDGEDSLACDGMLSVLVTDGTAPYSYTWTNGATNYTTSAIQDLCSGTYALSVVDANGCSATNSAVINDTLIPVIVGDTLIFTDNIYQDSTIIGADTSDWIENCTFDYDLVTSATISSYVDNGSSTIVTWLISLSDGSTIPIEATYNLSPGTAGVYDLTLQLTCSQKSDPKFLVANSRLYYEGSTIGIQSNSLSAILLYPNPAKSTLSISGINESFQFEIRDIQGKLLKQGANDKQINIENLPAGTYVIGISTDSEVKQLRFVKI